MISYKAYLTFLLFGVVIFYNPDASIAQQAESSLKDFEGYYQFQQIKELYLHIIVSGDKLKQIREWDGRNVVLDRVSDLEFTNEETRLKISFSKDDNRRVNELRIGGDSWIKVNNYVPEKTAIDPVKAKSALDQKAEALVAVINSNSRNAVTKFVEENFSESLKASSANHFVDGAQTTYRLTGGIKYHKSLYFNPDAFFSEYQYKSNKLNNIYEFSLKLDKNHKIKLYNGRIISSLTTPAKPANQEELVKKLEKTFKALTDKDIFSGAVLLAKGNHTLFTFASGKANKESNFKNTLDTRFNLGSMNKMFTALSIMQLAEQGKVDLNAPVSKYIDTTWLPKRIADQISIHHLLSHTSGMGDFFSQAFQDAPVSQLVTLDGYKRFVKTDQLNFKPGTDWSYSNAGMILLGAVIEQVSGTNYFEYVSAHIYKPSGMTASYGWGLTGNTDNMALGYIPQPDGSYKSNLNSAYTRSSSAGGGYSTVTDLHKFAMALISDKLVSDSSKSKIFKDYMGRQYGYGFQLWGSAQTRIIGHSGGAAGISAVVYIFPESEYVIAVLSNYDGGSYFTGEYVLSEVMSLIE